MSRFLVTGGAGFIGSHIVEALTKKNHYVRVLDDFSSGKIDNLKPFLKKIDLIRGSIVSKDTCLKASSGIDFVLHQAALRSVPESMEDPHLYNRVNITGTLNMLEAARKHKVKRFVFASSSSVYGEVKCYPEKESFIPAPISPYALTKLAGEEYCRIFSVQFGLPAIALRYFNVFGPRQALDDEYSVVIPKFINCILKNQSPPIYGDGRQSRDFIFVDNIVHANLLATQNSFLKFGVFNVASGEEYTVLKVVNSINMLLNKSIKPKFLAKRLGDVSRTLGDLSQAKAGLKFRPNVDFITGLSLTIEYWRKNA